MDLVRRPVRAVRVRRASAHDRTSHTRRRVLDQYRRLEKFALDTSYMHYISEGETTPTLPARESCLQGDSVQAERVPSGRGQDLLECLPAISHLLLDCPRQLLEHPLQELQHFGLV